MKIGVLLDSLRLPLRDGLDFAAKCGARGVQFYASRGELTPWSSTLSERRDFLAACRDKGLTLAALCGDQGGHGFERPEEHPAKIRQTRVLLDFARELGAPVVSTHIGVVPEDPRDPVYLSMKKALSELSRHGASVGVRLAVETGPEPASRLARFLEDCGPAGLGVNFDPANLAMVQGSDPVEDFRMLAPHVVHVHAKDGQRKKVSDAREIYGAFAENDFSNLDVNEFFTELPLGSGAVPFPALIAEIRRSGYAGFLTIEREAGDDRLGDVHRGVAFLEGLVGG